MTDPLMNDTDSTVTGLGPHHSGSQADVAARRPSADLLTLGAGVGALGVAGSALLGLDIRWVLATLAMLAGLLLVISTVQPRRS